MIDKQAMMRPTPGLAITFGWMLILLMALPAIWFGASRIWAKVAAEEWTLVRATVLSSKAYHRTGKSNDWCVMLHYSYPALGKRYESRAIGTSRVGNAGCERSEERLRERWGDLAPGTLLRARFDPQAPERAAIVVEKVDALDCVMILIGLIILCGSAWEIRNQMKR